MPPDRQAGQLAALNLVVGVPVGEEQQQRQRSQDGCRVPVLQGDPCDQQDDGGEGQADKGGAGSLACRELADVARQQRGRWEQGNQEGMQDPGAAHARSTTS